MSSVPELPADLAALELVSPATETEWASYFDLRWRLLRQPWNQTRGSEKDDSDAASYHLMLRAPENGPALAVGRLHLNSPREAQVRYMAVDPAWQGKGLGGRILAGLETRARDLGCDEVVLNARESAIAFYIRHGYAMEREADTLFGVVRHVRMRKGLL